MAKTVFRAIVALRFPQKYWSDWRGPPNNEYASNPVRDEEIPVRTVNGVRTALRPEEQHGDAEDNGNGRRWMSCDKDWMNFDIDPQNSTWPSAGGFDQGLTDGRSPRRRLYGCHCHSGSSFYTSSVEGQ